MKEKLTKEDKKMLREKFITEYSKRKGWDVNNLSTSQMMRIISEQGYKSPKLIN